ncbi:MAG TPA: ATP-binding protein [Tepidisphaeraceae bacterium]|nr:ATP-binding protein [Tepidisphaeraceae bacterium]
MTTDRERRDIDELRNRLREAEETLSAIRNGEVDSLVVNGPDGERIYSLKGAEQPYRIFVEQMLEGAVILNDRGTILYSNHRFAEMMHTPLERVIGSSINLFVREDDQTLLGDILHRPEGRKVRLQLNAINGTPVSALLSFNAMPHSEIGAISLVVTDLTEQEEKRELAAAVENLRSAQAQLERKNEELSHARRAAEEANDAKDNFLAALSHELRTPLTPVLMTIETIESDPGLDRAMRSQLEMMRRNVQLEARLIDDLLDITRIVRGKIDLRSERVNMHAVIAQAIEICRSDNSARNLKILQELNADHFFVEGDSVRLHQILWNLIRNAIKFTPDGGTIRIGTSNQGQVLQLSVADTGIGIEPEMIDKLFTPFEQTSRIITQKFGGLGLGLAISKRLAELHGGSLFVSSRGRGYGSTFTLNLPCAAMAQNDESQITDKPVGRSPSQLQILLVEDHEDTRVSLALILGRKHAVREAESIGAALKAASEHRFDLVISDLGLPDGSGLELMRQLRQQYSLRGICLSGFGMEEDVSRSAAVGFDHHLTKPVDFNKLEAVIDSISPAPGTTCADGCDDRYAHNRPDPHTDSTLTSKRPKV